MKTTFIHYKFYNMATIFIVMFISTLQSAEKPINSTRFKKTSNIDPNDLLLLGAKNCTLPMIVHAINKGANINHQDEDGCTMLHYLVTHKNTPSIQSIIDQLKIIGLNPNIPNKYGNSACDYRNLYGYSHNLE